MADLAWVALEFAYGGDILDLFWIFDGRAAGEVIWDSPEEDL